MTRLALSFVFALPLSAGAAVSTVKVEGSGDVAQYLIPLKNPCI